MENRKHLSFNQYSSSSGDSSTNKASSNPSYELITGQESDYRATLLPKHQGVPGGGLQQRKVTNQEDSETISLVTMSGGETDTDGVPSTRSTRSRGGTVPRQGARRGWFGARLPSSRAFGLNDNLDGKTRKERLKEFPPNVVRNQKYSIFTFIPKVLYNQVKPFPHDVAYDLMLL